MLYRSSFVAVFVIHLCLLNYQIIHSLYLLINNNVNLVKLS
jgi:hypothetical protein